MNEDIQHAMGVLAAKGLGGPVPPRDVMAAFKTLLKAGLIVRVNMSADEAFQEAKRNLGKTF